MSDDFNRDLFDDDDEFSDFDDDFGDFDDGFGDFDDFDNDNVIDNDLGGFDDGLGDFDDDFGDEDDLFADDLLGDFDDDFGDDGDDFGDDEFGEPEQEENNSFRTILLAMAGLFIFGIVLIVGLFLFNNFSDTSMEETRVAIENENATIEAQVFASSTAAVLGQTATLEAQVAATQTTDAEERATEQAEIEATATGAVVVQTQTQEAIEQATQDFFATQTQEALDEEEEAVVAATQTAEVIQATLNPVSDRTPLLFNGQPVQTADGTPVVLIQGEPVIIINDQPVPVSPGSQLQTADGMAVTINPDGSVSSSGDEQPMPTTAGDSVPLDAVQMTATALAELFNATPTQAVIQPTEDLGTGGGIATTVPDDPDATSIPDIGQGGGGDELPDTGLFDDVFGSNPLLIVMLAVGLFGVIIVSRSARSANNKA
ncbi:MAG: hypothetical protein AAF846_09555 [Chloroflexota bacterium]